MSAINKKNLLEFATKIRKSSQLPFLWQQGVFHDYVGFFGEEAEKRQGYSIARCGRALPSPNWAGKYTTNLLGVSYTQSDRRQENFGPGTCKPDQILCEHHLPAHCSQEEGDDDLPSPKYRGWQDTAACFHSFLPISQAPTNTSTPDLLHTHPQHLASCVDEQHKSLFTNKYVPSKALSRWCRHTLEPHSTLRPPEDH